MYAQSRGGVHIMVQVVRDKTGEKRVDVTKLGKKDDLEKKKGISHQQNEEIENPFCMSSKKKKYALT